VTVVVVVMPRDRWFVLDLGEPQETDVVVRDANRSRGSWGSELVWVERVGQDCCSCCAGGRDRGHGRPRRRVSDWFAVCVFVALAVAMVVCVVVVWSVALEGVEDASGEAIS
jgi:hypothetical protein